MVKATMKIFFKKRKSGYSPLRDVRQHTVYIVQRFSDFAIIASKMKMPLQKTRAALSSTYKAR